MNGFAIIDATLNWPNVDGPAVAARTAENRKGKLAKGLEAVPSQRVLQVILGHGAGVIFQPFSRYPKAKTFCERDWGCGCLDIAF